MYRVSRASSLVTKSVFRAASSVAHLDKLIQPKLDLPFKTLVELQQNSSKAYATNPMLGTKVGKQFEWITYAEFDVEVGKTRAILNELKVGVDDKVAIISNNRMEWALVNYGTVGLGGQIVPMYEAQLEKDWQYILKDSDSKVLIVATEEIYKKTKDYVGKIGKVEHVLCLDAPEDQPHSFKAWLKKAGSLPLAPARTDVKEDDICTVIYTSGTTGNPKGVELSHKNIVTDCQMATELWQSNFIELGQQCTLAFLPWAHVYGVTCELHQFSSVGSARAIVPSRDQILECLNLAAPTAILSVPMLFNRVYDGVMKNLSEQSPLKQKIVKHALKVARARNEALEFGRPVPYFTNLQHKIFDKIVLSKIRARLGGRLKYMAAGGAATSTPVLQFFEDIGVPIMEGYGLTETSPMITSSTIPWSGRRLGCVGVPLPGVTVRIVDPDDVSKELPSDQDGEVTAHGPNVMVRYRNNQKATDEVFYQHDGKRFFRTGDMGRMVEGKFLKITGRLKEQFKLENGKFVVPAPLEDAFARSPYILQTFIGGINHPSTVALIVPNWDNLRAWHAKFEKELTAKFPTAEQLANPDTQNLEIFEEPAFRDLISQEMIRVSTHLKSFERPSHWQPVVHAFTQENQMMTPKQSFRRVNIIKAYQHKIDALYKGDGNVVKYKQHV